MPALRPALIVFAKVPRPGRVKTRLVPPLTAEEAADLYDAFLRDALGAYAIPGAFGRDVAVRLYLGTDEAVPDGLVPAGVSVHRQHGEGLGARMLRAFVETFAAGHDAAVVIGTDHPALPLAFVGEAFRALEVPLAAVLGPAADGGYYLLGLSEVAPALFAMEYSHARVLEDTLARAFAAGLQPVLLPEHEDVDDAGALRKLVRAVERGEAAVGARTAAALAALRRAHPALLSASDAPPGTSGAAGFGTVVA
ncbi:MAG: TIGR04282 family arsenosugar biosynthesis glycosyltransferase [Rubricoccaceae bacterium]